ncbi:MAG TPA: sigma 54-interacting transcriptional regulator, partial [Myxococcaceae bacterium]|nr:sigma 54-interacting transcriptional regulator [Myxococcaceae bacterium]
MEAALIAALLGRRAEAESLLALARVSLPTQARVSLELASALVMLEAGHPSRVAGALERAEALPGFIEVPVLRVLSLCLHAQLLLLEGATTAAVRAALEGLEVLPPESEGDVLAAYAHFVAAECLLASEEAAAAEARLASPSLLAGRHGVLAARTDMLRARIGLALGSSSPEQLRSTLEGTIARLERLGAPRELALAFITQAQVVALEGKGVPAGWLVRAQPLLVKAGTAADLRLLRQSFRSFGRRKIDRLCTADVVSMTESLWESHARLRDVVSAQRDARSFRIAPPGPVPSPIDQAVDDSLASVQRAVEELIRILEQTILESGQLSHLVAVSQEISSIGCLEELLGAIPRLAVALVTTASAGLVEVTEGGDFSLVSGEQAPPSIPVETLREAMVAVLREGKPRVLTEQVGAACSLRPRERYADGRCTVIPLQQAGGELVLVLGRSGLQAPFYERDIEHLSVFGSLCGAAISRVRSDTALRQAAARDAAILSAIRDGILHLDGEGLILGLNQAAERLLRIAREQVLGRRLQEVDALAPLGETLESGRSIADEVIGLRHGDVLVRSQAHEGGVVVTVQELASAQRLAHKLVGSQARFTFEDLIGEDPSFLACLEDARLAARSEVPLLITGESGTGKELLAQAIHRASPGAGMPFIGINVAAFPRELLESELFGYEKGAFTGARSGGNPGKFEFADRGTLLLDEIGDMPLEMQVKLLRVLQERTLQRLGGSRDISFRARVIATTHRDLEEAVEEGTFRLDLFHRLRVVHLRLPPLRERRADIPLLVEHHLRRHAERLRRRSLRVDSQVLAAFMVYDWPGNV